MNTRKQGGITISTDRERAIFNRLAAAEREKNKIVTPGFIRVEKLLQNGNPKMDFQVLRDTNSDSITEQKLDRNDKFLATHLGLFLMLRDPSITGAEVLQTYPNAEVFDAMDGDDPTLYLRDARHLETIYNGKLSITVGQTKYVEALDTRRFRNVPTSQQITIEDATPVVISKIGNSEQSEKTGFIDLTPQITFDGDQKNLITLEAPISGSHKIQSSTAPLAYVVLVMRGFLITNR